MTETTPGSLNEQQMRRAIRDNMFRARLDAMRMNGPIFSSASGSWITDTSGKRYLDFNAGQMSSALGHNHAKIREVLARSGQTMLHASTSFYNEFEITLAERLARKLPAPLQKSYFLLSGSDANEMAIGVARKFTGGYEVAGTHLGFHGYSDTTRGVSFIASRRGYPMHPDGAHAIFTPYCYRCPLQKTFPECDIACLDASFELLDQQIVESLAAVITEPLISAGGVIEPPPGWLAKLQQMAHERDALVILDECQTGLAKLGTWWAFEQEGVTPDIFTLAKHFGGGLPISAVITTAEIEETVATAGFVFGHSNNSDPIGALAATAVLEIIEEEDLLGRALHIGKKMRDILSELQSRHAIIGDVRGRGLIHGIELVRDRDTKEPTNVAGSIIEEHCLQNGLILSLRGASLGKHESGNVLRLVPPFSTSNNDLERAGEILDGALTAAAHVEGI